MVLIDAVFVNNGGGKVLLNYLVEKIEHSELRVYFLLDSRIRASVNIKTKYVSFVNGSFIRRHIFYLKNKNRFRKILCFGNVPPSVRTSAECYVYFHQALFLKDSPSMIRNGELVNVVKKFAILSLRNNADKWLVQTSIMKNRLIKSLRLLPKNIEILPFYNFTPRNVKAVGDRNFGFFYPSLGSPHKNHNLLFKSFSEFYLLHGRGELIVTIENDSVKLLKEIELLKTLGIPIRNIGFVDTREVIQKYNECIFVVYPSLEESFGLGLIEAGLMGCYLIAINLPYVNDVCVPSLTFENNVQSLVKAFEESLNYRNLEVSTIKVHDNIGELVRLLTH